MRIGGILVGAAIFFGATSANAALTSSEKGQIKDFVAGARAENAQKVRALVARTDLTPEESVAALSAAVTPVAFTEQRGVFLKELAFGGASAASRPVLVLAEVKALLARADAIYQRFVGGLDHEPRAVQELIAIYGWLDATIANAGNPTSTSHDGSAGIPAATYEECSRALRDHVEQQARWLKGDGVVPETVSRLRAQAQVTLVDMLPDGLTRRVDAADRLAIKGARRTMLTEWGVLFADAGKIDDAKVERVRQVLARLPGARRDLGLVYAGDARGGTQPLRARGLVAYVAPVAERYPFADEATPGAYDATSSAIAHDLAVIAAKRALDKLTDLRAQAERDAAAAAGDPSRLLGRPRAPSVEHVVGAAIHALMTDAPRAVDLSLARLLGSRPETAALLSDALGALAAFPPSEEADAKGPSVELGKANAWTTASAIRLAPNGAAIGFTLDGHAWAIDRASPTYVVLAARRNGQPVSAGQLSAKGVPREGSKWTDSGYTFTKLRGSPRVGLSTGSDTNAGPNVKLLGGGSDGFDAVMVAPPGPDFTLEGELVVRDAPGGVALRASSTKKGLRGVALVVTPGGRAALTIVDDGGETNLAAPIESPSGPVAVRITVQGANVEAVVGKSTLKGTLPESLAKGDVAVIGKRNANVEIAGFTLKRK
ncbi:MAG: hypothetical protein KF764_20615 [Labilithrix sp.]|nr:hypothetical protein [Labilithrix sp.]